MPTYEYRCSKCGVFEEFHGINQRIEKCPRCGGEVQRLISQNSNIIFKGSGFYVTDYRNSDSSKKSTSKSSTGSSKASESSKTESKAS